MICRNFRQLHPWRSRQGGFTLIELLVVVSLVSVLTFIGLSVVQRSRQLSEQTACLSRMRQVAAATLLYTQEHQGRFPGPLPGNHGAFYTLSSNTLAGHLVPYLDLPPARAGERLVAPIMECPAVLRQIGGQGGQRNATIFFNAPTTALPEGSFRPFGYIASGSTTLNPVTVTELTDKGVMTRVALLTETDRHLNPSLGSNRNAAWQIVHGTGRNVSYADGRVEYRSIQ